MKNLGYYNGKYDEIEKCKFRCLTEFVGLVTVFMMQRMLIIILF